MTYNVLRPRAGVIFMRLILLTILLLFAAAPLAAGECCSPGGSGDDSVQPKLQIASAGVAVSDLASMPMTVSDCGCCTGSGDCDDCVSCTASVSAHWVVSRGTLAETLATVVGLIEWRQPVSQSYGSLLRPPQHLS